MHCPWGGSLPQSPVPSGGSGVRGQSTLSPLGLPQPLKLQTRLLGPPTGSC